MGWLANGNDEVLCLGIDCQMFFLGLEGELGQLLSVCHSDCFVWKMISCLNSFWMGALFRMAISSAKKTCPYWKRAGTADDFSSLRVRYSDVDFGNIIMPKEPNFFLMEMSDSDRRW